MIYDDGIKAWEVLGTNKTRIAPRFADTDVRSPTSSAGGIVSMVEEPSPLVEQTQGKWWTEDERRRLASSVLEMKPQSRDDWDRVAEAVGNGRSRNACRHRWLQQENPELHEKAAKVSDHGLYSKHRLPCNRVSPINSGCG